MKRELVLGLSILCAAAAVAATEGCGKKAPPPPPPPLVVVTPVIQKDVPVYGEWIGTTAGDINAEIRPQITGYLLRRIYDEGSFVRSGQLLFEIDPRQIRAQLQQAEANLGQGRANLAKAERDVARFRPLAEQRAISQQELDNAVSAEQVARAAVVALEAAVDQARLYLSWTRVTSPIGGIAGAATAQVGDLLTPQSVLATVSRVDPLRVFFKLSEQEYLHYRESEAPPAPAAAPAAAGPRISQLEMVLSDGTVFPHPGRLIFTDREVDVKTGTISACGLFPNPGNLLRPGQYAKVRAETSIDRGALLVPQRAVNELQGGYQVAVVGPDSKADVRNVQVGQRIGSLWVIDSGLHAGEHVVIEGFSRAKSGTLVKPEVSPAQAAAAAAGNPAPAPSPAPAGK
ncbi:MAG TPA: efflux RND transporter periplasmic adaptor subunit [Thermoanaerobaculia bacterium]|nr:efflux RND transporter periplasmic adaptor subunit [Thermoanaerobaculia bacterium]